MIEYDRAPDNPNALAWRMAGHNRDANYIQAMVKRDYTNAPDIETIKGYIAKRTGKSEKVPDVPCRSDGEHFQVRGLCEPLRWPCGHKRTWNNTHTVKGNARCRECRRNRWLFGFRAVVMKRLIGNLEDYQKNAETVLAARLEELRDARGEHFNRIPARELLVAIARRFDMTYAAMIGSRGTADHANARTVFCRIMRERGLSYPLIGRLLGGRDHSTIINSIRNFDIYARRDPRVMETYMALRDREVT